MVMNPKGERPDKLKNLMRLVNRAELSSIRSTVSGIIDATNNPRSSAKDLKKVIEIDPPLTARILKLANSAYYCPLGAIKEIQHAIIFVGFDALKELALSQKVCELFAQDESINGYSRTSLWKHSVAVALLGKMIYRREFGERGENAYIAGLLHDIGIIVEDQFFHKDFLNILDKAQDEEKDLSKAEYEVLGYTHADIGKTVTDTWDLSEEFVMAVGYHHNPEGVTQEFSRIVSTLYIADYLCQERGLGYRHKSTQNKAVFNKCLKRLALEPHALDLIVEDMEDEIATMEAEGLLHYESCES